MRRMFFVGCGGTGGSVLAYVMDQLRAEFSHAGLNGIPAAWQFVHVDVPRTCDTRIPGVRNVPDQGGTYIDVAPFDSTYKSAELLVTQRVSGEAGKVYEADTAMAQLGSWLPRNPADVRVSLSDGAGQMRQVGRIATLSSLTKVQQELGKAWDAMSSMQARTEGKAAAAAMPQLSTYASNDPPVIFIVASMAGGAGASMVLDICRLTAELPGSVPDTTAVFVATASVFESLGEGATRGVLPNTLAMFGELLAAQSGSAGKVDSYLIRALGVGGGEGVSVPFTRVLPIGNKVGLSGNVATFGDGTQRTVYRGLGRAIAALVTSDAAFEPWVSYVVGNPLPTPQQQELAAWGGDRQAHQWQGFGYASVSMGRDRYLHYAAQRLARATVDHLLSGHFTAQDTRTAEQAINDLIAARWDVICSRLGLPAQRGQDGRPAFKQWASEVFRRPLQGPASDLTGSLDGVFPQTSGATEDAATLREAIRARLGSAQQRLTAAADAAGYRLAFGWLEAFAQRLEQVAVEEMAQGGLSYTQELIGRISAHVNEWIAEGLHHFVRGVGNIGEPPEREYLAGMKGMVRADALYAEIRTRYRPYLANQASARAAAHVLQSLQDSERGLFTPLTRTLGNNVEGLRRRTDEPATQVGLAVVDTDSYRAWPNESDHVSERWFTSVNERLLTPPSTFPQQFRVDLPPAIEAHTEERGYQAVRQRAVASLVRGDWKVVGGDESAGGPLVREHGWVPPTMVRLPDGIDTRVPTSAGYRLDLTPVAVLERAKAFVNRAGMPFRRFADVSLREFILEHDGSAQGEERAKAVLTAFATALEAARPLIEVDGAVVKELHGTNPHIRYDLSEVPFAELALSDEIIQSLRRVAQIDPEYIRGLQDAPPFTANQYTTRIDIFGSYVAYSPLAFSGVLQPVVQGWTKAHQQEGSADEFWRLRRSRSLSAALPITEAERKALVGGWFVGQITGRVVLPPRGVDDPVRVYSDAADRWLVFPHPRLTPLKDFRADYDYLPAILESMLLAMARFGEAPVGASMSPYRALRRMWDDDLNGPTNTSSDIFVLAGQRLLQDWLGGNDISGSQSVVSVVAGQPGSRRDDALEWVQRIRRLIGTELMPAGLEGAPGGGAFSRIVSREQALRSPMLRDLARDAWLVTGDLESWLKAEEGNGGGQIRF
jgi:hypothetical protein